MYRLYVQGIEKSWKKIKSEEKLQNEIDKIFLDYKISYNSLQI